MTAWIQKIHGQRKMILTDTPERSLRAQEVEIATLYAGASLTEVLSEQGKYLLAPGMPYVPGYEFLGQVRRVKSPGTNFQVGDWVCGILPRGGAYSSRIITPAKYLVPLTPSSPFKESGAALINFLTAQELLAPLITRGISGKVFLRGLAGGVGLAVLTLARDYKIAVWGTCSEAKRNVVESRGGHWLDRKLSLENQKDKLPPGGFDLVLDAFGLEAFQESVRYLKKGGHFQAYGFLGSRSPLWEALRGGVYLFFKALVSGFHFGVVSVPWMVFTRTKHYRSTLKEILSRIALGNLDPGPIQVFPFSEVMKVHRKIEASEISGKALLDFSEPSQP